MANAVLVIVVGAFMAGLMVAVFAGMGSAECEQARNEYLSSDSVSVRENIVSSNGECFANN